MAIDKEELRQALSDSLSVSIETQHRKDYDGNRVDIIVTIRFDGEIITTDKDYISLCFV